MRCRPILFSAPMVLAILAGKKSQTRRLVRFKWKDWNRDHSGVHMFMCSDGRPAFADCVLDPAVRRAMANKPGMKCPLGDRDDRLWVRETWATEKKHDRKKPSRVPRGARIWYLADGKKPQWAGRGRPSIFMMQWMSRIELHIDHVAVQRVDEISEVDAIAEGVSLDVGCPCDGDAEPPGRHRKLCRWNRRNWTGKTPLGVFDPNRMAFAVLWDAINGKRARFDHGPWVWVVMFRSCAHGLS